MSFVQTSQTNFTLDGKKWVPIGGSTYDISWPRTQARVEDYISKALFMNLNIIRIVNFFGSDSGRNEAQWAHADYIINRSKEVGLKVLLDLSDFCAVVGGKTGENCGLPSGKTHWLEFVNWLFNRLNTITGVKYKDDDTIAIVAISGENGHMGGLRNREFFSEVSAAIKATGAKQVIHAGGQIPELILSSKYTTAWGIQQDMLSIPTIDCVSTHPYYTLQNMRDLFPLLEAYSKEKNKPWFIEEFGYNQSVSVFHHDHDRAATMKMVYNLAFKHNCAGVLFWNIDGGYYNHTTKSGGGYGINTNTPLTAEVVRRFSKYPNVMNRVPIEFT